MSGVPSRLVKALIEEWKKDYGPTFPLYGKNTVRNDISGSVRPLVASTEIPHEKILAEKSGISKRTITKIMREEVEVVPLDVADDLSTAMNRADVWYCEWHEYR